MTPTYFSNEQIAAFRALLGLWRPDTVILIGASALGCHIDMRWRKTNDLDLSLSVSLDEYPAGLDRVAGWTRHPKKEHEWKSPDGVRVDIVPSGKELLEAGELIWPESGFRMSLVGFRLVYERAERLRIADALTIHVAPVSVVALLKMNAFLDRPTERDRDLEDLSYLLEGYLADDEERRYTPEIIDRDLSFEDTNAFLLGKDISAIAGNTERQVVSDFFARLQDDRDSMAARMLRKAPVQWREDPQLLTDRIRAFKQGFD